MVKNKKKRKSNHNKKRKKSSISLSALNDIATQWASEVQAKSPITEANEPPPSSDTTSVAATPITAAQSMAPSTSTAPSTAPSTHSTAPSTSTAPPAVTYTQKVLSRPHSPPMERAQPMVPAVHRAAAVTAPRPLSWTQLKQCILSGDRIFKMSLTQFCAEGAGTATVYLLCPTSLILREWSDRLERFHEWICSDGVFCRFLPISQQHDGVRRFVMMEFALIEHAKVARERLRVKLKTDSITFVPWHFGHGANSLSLSLSL